MMNDDSGWNERAARPTCRHCGARTTGGLNPYTCRSCNEAATPVPESRPVHGLDVDGYDSREVRRGVEAWRCGVSADPARLRRFQADCRERFLAAKRLTHGRTASQAA